MVITLYKVVKNFEGSHLWSHKTITWGHVMIKNFISLVKILFSPFYGEMFVQEIY